LHAQNLADTIIKDIEAKKYEVPTPIQTQGVPIALSGRDILGCAETGSGKTASFAIPMIQHVLHQAALRAGDGPIGLVLAPTRELAQQIDKEVKAFSSSSNVRTCIVVGGVQMQEQKYDLRNGVHIIVATPGRFNDHLQQGNTNLGRVSFVVLDEADRMLDMGFEPQIKDILQQLQPKHQTLLFSATMPVEIEDLARQYLNKPVVCKVRAWVGGANRGAEARRGWVLGSAGCTDCGLQGGVGTGCWVAGPGCSVTSARQLGCLGCLGVGANAAGQRCRGDCHCCRGEADRRPAAWGVVAWRSSAHRGWPCWGSCCPHCQAQRVSHRCRRSSQQDRGGRPCAFTNATIPASAPLLPRPQPPLPSPAPQPPPPPPRLARSAHPRPMWRSTWSRPTTTRRWTCCWRCCRCARPALVAAAAAVVRCGLPAACAAVPPSAG
jgi:hypothetical protein